MPPKIEGIKQNLEINKPKPVEPQIVKPKPAEVKFLPDQDKNLFLRQNNLFGDTLKVNLLAKFDDGGGGSTINQKKVDDAVKSIKDSLSQGFLDWDVTKGDLNNIQKQFQNLNADEANAAFKKLSDDDIKNWAEELNGLNGGYSREEKQKLFEELAGKLNGENLARFAKAFGKDNENDLQDLGRAVANSPSSQTKVDFVANMRDQIEDNPAASKAIAETIIGLKNDPANLDKAIGKLSDSQLLEIMDNISIRSYQVTGYGGTATTIDYKGDLLGQMLDAASASKDPKVKARMFDAGAQQLKKIDDAPGLMPSTAIIGKGEAADKIREGLTKILDSDTEGTITELNKGRRNEGLVAYVKSMLNEGEDSQKKLGVFMSRLLTGNNNDQDQITRFEQQAPGTTDKPYYQNARTLGFFAGAIAAGTESIAKDNERKGDILKNVFDTAAGIIGAKFPVEAALGKGLSIELVDQVVSSVNDKNFNVRDALIKLSFPVVPDKTPDNYNDNELYTGPPVTDYEAAFDSIAD